MIITYPAWTVNWKNKKTDKNGVKPAMRSGSAVQKGLFETVEDELKLRNYSRKTMKAYVGHLLQASVKTRPVIPSDIRLRLTFWKRALTFVTFKSC